MDVTAAYGSDAAKRVLIIDDSSAMRGWLRRVLSADPRLLVVGEAANAIEARDCLKAHAVDVLTLDIEMPGMGGLEFLTRLMRSRPMPVVMMSSLTAAGSEAAVQALSHGAIDCMIKPLCDYGDDLTKDVCERVFHAANIHVSQLQIGFRARKRWKACNESTAPPLEQRQFYPPDALILIGASTGGVAALETVLPALDPHGPPVVVVQHMPGNFLARFSERLNRQLPQNVYLANENHPLGQGDIILAPGNGQHTTLRRRTDGWCCHFIENDPPARYCPSVDVLFASAMSAARHVSAAILTGLGRDGAKGLLTLAQAGAATFGQDEASSVVYGMPKAARALDAVRQELSLHEIGFALRESRLVSRPPGFSHLRQKP